MVCGVRCVVTGVRVWCVGAFGVRAVFSEWCMCGVCLVCGAFGVCVVCVMCSVCVWFVLCVFGVCVRARAWCVCVCVCLVCLVCVFGVRCVCI